MSLGSSKIDILEFFYEHISEDDWLEGVDLYQAERIKEIRDYHGLITGNVSSNIGRKQEVRLKIHPGGHCIQWIECTCKKNRTNGRYCEHIAALMIHIDREDPQILGQLDSKMPLKPPGKLKGKKAAEQLTETKSAGATETIIDRLQGSIHSVSLLAHGPTLRVRLAIKEGQLTHYDLSTDNAAKFLKEHPKLKSASPDVNELKVSKVSAEPATLLSLDVKDDIVAERGFFIKSPKNSKDHLLTPEKLKSRIVKCKRIDKNTTRSREADYEFITAKQLAKFTGQEFIFIPHRGYFPIDASGVSPIWYDQPVKTVFKNDDAANLAKNNYKDLIEFSTVYLPTEIYSMDVNEAPKMLEIQVKSESNGWFTLDPKYGSGEKSISMSELMDLFKKKKKGYIKAGQSWLKIPELITQYDWQLDETGKYIQVDSVGLMRLKAALGDYDRFVGSKKMLDELRNRTEFKTNVPMPSLEHSKLNLRNYQKTGLKWLWWLYHNNLHGLLADEMGLGKTHQAMGLLTAILNEKPDAKFLVVAPTTVLDHWLDKMTEFAPKIKGAKHHGAKRIQSFASVGTAHHAIITSYGIVLRDIKKICDVKWDAIILDEAHFVKNSDTATYQAVCKIPSKIRVCLTGTPMENHLGELKNIFDFIVPGFLGSDQYFRKNIKGPIEAGGNPDVELELQKLIYPFKLRRTKDNVLKELPAKVEDIRRCELSAEQVDMYRTVLRMQAQPLLNTLKDDSSPIPYLHVFAVLTLLKQVCDHPHLVAKDKDWRTHESGKFELLKELLQEAFDSNHKVVIYSQYLGMIQIIEEYMNSLNVGSVTLTGQSKNRGKLIHKFQTDENCRVFIGSLLAGGIGIDLTAASVVIHYDRWWNASKENQATDRVHRIGQHKNVQVLKLVTRGTLEEKIDLLINSKQKLFQKFMDKDEEVFKNLSRQELIELLQ